MQNRWKVLLVVFMISLSASAGLTWSYQHADIGKSFQFILSGLKRVLFPGATQLREETPVSEQESIKVETETQEPEVESEQKLEEVNEQTMPLGQELEEERKLWERKPLKDAWFYIFLPLPGEINQTNCLQYVESLELTFNIKPSGNISLTDEQGNNCIVVYWEKEQTCDINITLETKILRKVNESVLVDTTPHPYPIPENQIPENISIYLQPTKHIQSDDLTIVALAQNLSQGFNKEVDVVNNTLKWVHENIDYVCYREIVEKHGKYSDAVSTLKYKKGVCSHFATLMVTLLRAQGIPARGVHGYPFSPETQVLMELPMGHAWVQVYYPKIGWVDYDPAKDKTHLPHHFFIYTDPDTYGGWRRNWGLGLTCTTRAIGLGNDRIKLVQILTLPLEEQPEG